MDRSLRYSIGRGGTGGGGVGSRFDGKGGKGGGGGVADIKTGMIYLRRNFTLALMIVTSRQMLATASYLWLTRSKGYYMQSVSESPFTCKAPPFAEPRWTPECQPCEFVYLSFAPSARVSP